MKANQQHAYEITMSLTHTHYASGGISLSKDSKLLHDVKSEYKITVFLFFWFSFLFVLVVCVYVGVGGWDLKEESRGRWH